MSDETDSSVTKKDELKAAAFVVAILFPALTVAFVGAYGFAIWFSQMIFGPPSM